MKVVEVSFARMISSLLPATRFRPSPNRVMPNRKNARPPSREITFAMVIISNLSEKYLGITGFIIARVFVNVFLFLIFRQKYSV